MSRSTIPALAVALAVVGLIIAGVLETAGVLPDTDEAPAAIVPFAVISILLPAAVGLAIALHQPRNAIAWILLLGALSLASDALISLLGDAWSLQLDRAMWPLLYAWPIAIAFVFPNGRLLSPRWRWVAGAGAACFLGFMTIASLDTEPFEKPNESIATPFADSSFAHWIANSGVQWVWIPLWLGILGSLFAGATAIWLRFRRSTGVERLQILWLAWAAALIPLGLLICAASWTAVGGAEVVVYPFLLVMQGAVAIAIGVAVTRYRLYAIERLINRTAVYTAVTAVLGLTYLAVVVGLGVVLGRGSAWVTAAATLTVALAFRPLRAAVQNAVDRRFARSRYEGLRHVQAFEHQVRESRRAPEEIGRVLAEALRDPLAELRFWLPASEAFADASGEIVDELPDDGRACTEILREGVRTAVLLHDPVLLRRRDLLDDILAAATLSIEIARLRVELRLQLAEVQASRVRIVEAGYEERRRLERDLHDGAQQRLVSLGMQIRRTQRSLPKDARILDPALDKIVDEVSAAIADLRQIAAGVRPARLDDGLVAALHDLARTAPVPVDVDAPIGRVAASIEAAAYFVACEALTNSVKHASASKVALRAVRENGTLRMTISDNGIGGAVARRGSGLAGLKDRVAAHGGTLAIASPQGGGTRVEVAIPCDS